MVKSPEVALIKNGNILTVEPTNPQILLELSKILHFVERKRLPLTPANRKAGRYFENVRRNLYEMDFRGRLVTMFGFWRRIRDKLIELGYHVFCENKTPPPPDVYKPVWENIKEFDLRPHQLDTLQRMSKAYGGLVNCPPGFGKTFLLGLYCRLYPKATFAITTYRADVISQRIYPELSQIVPGVGLITGSKKKWGSRVNCFSLRSISHSTFEENFVLIDEVHEAAADEASKSLARFINARIFGLSASLNSRSDGKDLRLIGLCGETLIHVTYEQAENAGMVVPIHVITRPVRIDYDPCSGIETTDPKFQRYAYWANDVRNEIIADDARFYANDDNQVLISVNTIEHAMNLKKLLPDFELVYAAKKLKPGELNYYIREGCITEDEPEMTRERKDILTKRFTAGKLRKAICTSVWNVGVSFNQLNVLLRAGGGSSKITDTQLPGRVSRLHDGKLHGLVLDYEDGFNQTTSRWFNSRVKSYVGHGWPVSKKRVKFEEVLE